uniref:DegT/DnrJ/EryC1/StrS aminotransferase family protein n=1 Tax=Globisporangium ultimum (strain ATCC 200006 / CBS 805.95 / DAOM BR144) TaxID=431595 RepID=K3WUU4_GLOUD
MAAAASPSASTTLAKRTELKPFGALENWSAACPWAIFPRKRLDVTYKDVAAGLQSCLRLRESQREEVEAKLTHHWDPTGHTMATLSIRTGFDLLLQTLKLPEGSEILCSAVTIPDMLYLVRYHGLIAVPVDVHPDTLAVDMDAMKKSLTSKTRAILIAHIFGSRFSLDPVLDFAEANDLMVIEDCAQAFSGMTYTGDHRADVSMFSFGSIKTATSFGGALIRVNNLMILEEMKRRERRYPSQTNVFFFKKLLKYGVFHGVTSPAVFGLFLHACHAVGANHDQVITSAIRGFSGGELVSLLQFRPSMALLGLLHHRLVHFDDPYIQLRKLKSEQLRDGIANIPNVHIPAHHAEEHVYWLFPVMVPSPQHVVNYMSKHGFDVTSGATQLAFVPSPLGPEHDPKNAKFLMTQSVPAFFLLRILVYLPVTAEMPDWALKKMIQCFRTAVTSSRL